LRPNARQSWILPGRILRITGGITDVRDNGG
jgi:hypothetical protein